MTAEFVTEISERAIWTALMVAGPPLLFGLTAGLITSIFQAVTQINEATLTFLPKILAIAISFAIFLPWMISVIVGFTTQVLINIPSYAH